jgi:hypothetical protein
MRAFFVVLLILCALGGGLYAVAGITEAKSAIQEIEGLIGALIVTVAVSAGYVASAIDQHRKAAFPPLPKVELK